MKHDKIDAIFSKFIRLLCDFTCMRCHKKYPRNSQGLHCAHYHSRGKMSTRFERDNATALCYGCHSYLDHHPAEKAEFFLNLLGQKRFNKLNKLANTPMKIDKEAIYEELKKKVAMLE
jgi:hypothetical protein